MRSDRDNRFAVWTLFAIVVRILWFYFLCMELAAVADCLVFLQLQSERAEFDRETRRRKVRLYLSRRKAHSLLLERVKAGSSDSSCRSEDFVVWDWAEVARLNCI